MGTAETDSQALQVCTVYFTSQIWYGRAEQEAVVEVQSTEGGALLLAELAGSALD